MNRLRHSLLILALMAGVTSAVAEDAAAPASPNAAPAVTVVSVEKRVISEKSVVTGTLKAREEVFVTAGVDGLKIENLLADAGDSVAAGQVLATLSTDTLDILLSQNTSQLARSDAAVAQARAQITQAEATLTQAKSALERATALKAKGVVAQDVLDQRIAAADTSAAALLVAQQGLAAAEADKAVTEAARSDLMLRMTKTEIKSPAAGLILSRDTNVGAVVGGASGPLFRIARDGQIELEAEASETILARIQKDQAVEVLPAGATEPVMGKVRLVSPEINQASRLGLVRVELDGDELLKVGAFARGTIELARHDNLALPVAAIQSANGVSTVQRVTNNIVETVTVETGLSGDGYVEIVKGLAEGDVVVARAGTFLRDGDSVRPSVVSSEGAKG